jgi:hypothetical protein
MCICSKCANRCLWDFELPKDVCKVTAEPIKVTRKACDLFVDMEDPFGLNKDENKEGPENE